MASSAVPGKEHATGPSGTAAPAVSYRPSARLLPHLLDVYANTLSHHKAANYRWVHGYATLDKVALQPTPNVGQGQVAQTALLCNMRWLDSRHSLSHGFAERISISEAQSGAQSAKRRSMPWPQRDGSSYPAGPTDSSWWMKEALADRWTRKPSCRVNLALHKKDTKSGIYYDYQLQPASDETSQAGTCPRLSIVWYHRRRLRASSIFTVGEAQSNLSVSRDDGLLTTTGHTEELSALPSTLGPRAGLMEQSHTLLTAQVHFLDTDLALIHVPLHLYSYFAEPILQLILPAESSAVQTSDAAPNNEDITRTKRPWQYDHPFVNVSLTPVECSVACSATLAEKLFKPIRDNLAPSVKDQISISDEQYVVIQVDGEGIDAGQRVLELSSPLAMNGISIFFYSTYFSDYILVPQRSRAGVISALEARGFAFSQASEGFVNVSSPLMRPASRHRGSDSTTSLTSPDAHFSKDAFSHEPASPLEIQPPPTPPPSSISELETRTFRTLKQRHVVPMVDPTIQLVQCAGRKDSLRSGVGSHPSAIATQHRLQLGLVKCVTTFPRARFFSLTLTDTEPASMLLEKRLLLNFEDPSCGNTGDDQVLLGSKNNILIPITLDLRELPIESTGIVCGIAGRLVGNASRHIGTGRGPDLADSFESALDVGSLEMSYLSTARAGTVVIAEEELEAALEALKDIRT